MGKHNTPDIEDIQDVRRFCRDSWFSRNVNQTVLHLPDISETTQTIAFNTASPYDSFKNEIVKMNFKMFIDTVIVGVPDHTYSKADGRLYYIKVNVRSKTQQGFCPGVSRVSPLNIDAGGMWRPMQDTVRQIFWPSYTKYEQALAMFQAGTSIGEALSSHFAITLPPAGPVHIFHQDVHIGSIVDDKPKLLPKYAAMTTAVEEVCQL